jgi:Xaa-Pro aminopeptidase
VSEVPLLATPEGVARIQDALVELDLDAWLLCEFRGQNWIAAELLGTGSTTRRGFALVPRTGSPRAFVHAIELAAWRRWPWSVASYAGWREAARGLRALVSEYPGLALEYSPEGAIPTVDLVPAGTVEALRAAGVEPRSSADLISLFFSAWSPEQLTGHRRAAEVVARVGREAFQEAGRAVRAGQAHTESSLTRWIRSALERGGVAVDADAHVAVGARAADPHYAPDGEGEPIEGGALLLVDLWGRPSEDGVGADQTWMGVLGPTAPERAARVWETVREARDEAVAFLRRRAAAGARVRGWEVDDAARSVIAAAGHGERFIHRTGHSIDRRIHGSGPNLDNLETHDDRVLVAGVGFSVEPGIYLPGEMGVRSEINVHMGPDGPEVTPAEPQTDLILLDV